MAALQKFKLLATQCGVTQSPTRSPQTSPLVHLRRRKTPLQMLLGRGSGRRSPPRRHQPAPPPLPPLPAARKRDTLKDLFGASSPPPASEEGGAEKPREVVKCEAYSMKVTGLCGETGSPRPGWIGFRHRSILRRAWRPVLLGIPEDE